MRILKCVLVIGAILFALVAGAAPQDKESVAPFGLEWGMSTAQVKGLGVDLAERPEKEFGQTYTATKVPKILSDVALVVLSFGYDDKLWRIVAVSKNFDNDPYGSAVQSRYDELARLLGEKYGPGKQNQPSDGLVIHVNPRRDEQNGVPRLVIEGEVINSATVALPVPQLKVELKDAGQHVVQTWTFAASTDRLLPGASVPFTTSVERPNEGATSMSVSFVDEPHPQDTNVFAGPPNFLMGIQTGRSFHYTDFDSNLVRVQIGIGATYSSTGYYIVFENKTLRAEFEKGKKAHEKDAL